MGYRLSSAAWPAKLVEALAKNFTVITFDNRGTGQSDKPLTGYALANMARDVAGLLDEIGIESTYVLGYSMGGAIAQEFTRQFPRSCGRTDPLRHHVRRSTRDLCRSLRCACHARSGWTVAGADRAEDLGGRPTHPAISAENRDAGRGPDAAGDRAAYAAACCGPAISGICRVRRLEGAFTNPMPYARLDRRSRPADPAGKLQDARTDSFRGQSSVVIPGGGHRVLWEAVEECTDLITGFLASIRNQPLRVAPDPSDQEDAAATPHALVSAAELLAALPLALAAGRTQISDNRSAVHVARLFPIWRRQADRHSRPAIHRQRPYCSAVFDVAKSARLSASDGRRTNELRRFIR